MTYAIEAGTAVAASLGVAVTIAALGGILLINRDRSRGRIATDDAAHFVTELEIIAHTAARPALASIDEVLLQVNEVIPPQQIESTSIRRERELYAIDEVTERLGRTIELMRPISAILNAADGLMVEGLAATRATVARRPIESLWEARPRFLIVSAGLRASQSGRRVEQWLVSSTRRRATLALGPYDIRADLIELRGTLVEASIALRRLIIEARRDPAIALEW